MGAQAVRFRSVPICERTFPFPILYHPLKGHHPELGKEVLPSLPEGMRKIGWDEEKDGKRGELSEASGTAAILEDSELEPRPSSPPSNPPCAPGLPLTRMSPPACHRASRSGLRAPAPRRRLRPRSAAACGWRPPSVRPERGLSGRRRRRPHRPGARRRSWSASAGCCCCRARLREGRESAAPRGWEVLPGVYPRSLLLPRNLGSSSRPQVPSLRPRPSLCAPGATHRRTASGAGTGGGLAPAGTRTSPRRARGRRSRSRAGCGGSRTLPGPSGAARGRRAGEGGAGRGGARRPIPAPTPSPRPRRRGSRAAGRATTGARRPRRGGRSGGGALRRPAPSGGGGSRRRASGPRVPRRVPGAAGARTAAAGAPRASPCPGGWASGGPRGRAAPARGPAGPGSGRVMGCGWPPTAPSTAARGSGASPGPGQGGTRGSARSEQPAPRLPRGPKSGTLDLETRALQAEGGRNF